MFIVRQPDCLCFTALDKLVHSLSKKQLFGAASNPLRSGGAGSAAPGRIRVDATSEDARAGARNDSSGNGRRHGGVPSQDRVGAATGNGFVDRAYGALDLGTNNCRLLVAKPTAWGFRVVDAFSRIVRLGEGLHHSGELSRPAMDRAIEALKVCTDKMIRRNVERSRLIATEACRQASNGREFIDRVRDETGLRLEIIDRETEANLAVAGSAALLDPECECALVFDIGGGSSELMLLAVRPDGHKIEAWTSLPVGVVTLAERFGGIDVTEQVFDAMVTDVLPLLREFEDRHGICGRFETGRSHMLGTSGTVTTLAGVHLNLQRYDRSRVDGCWLLTDDIGKVTRSLLAMTYDQRASSPCIGRERADLVLAGCAILEAIRQMWPCSRVRVADRGLREGILSTLMSEDGFAVPRIGMSAPPQPSAKPRRRRRRRNRNAGVGRTEA
jgi:exopolyphosphatase/guanosine-5'-triphosphate,3'-diphosphate pyrophosphatase